MDVNFMQIDLLLFLLGCALYFKIEDKKDEKNTSSKK